MPRSLIFCSSARRVAGSYMRSRGVSGVVFHSPAELYQMRIFTFFGRPYSTSSFKPS